MKQALIEEGAAFMTLEGRRLRSRANGSGAGNAGGPSAAEPVVTERFPVIVVGAGQAGLSAGYHLAREGVRFVILDAEARVGDPWRRRWDSLRLFTPAIFDGLDGMAFPAPPWSFPTKDEMADFLEAYARRFALPIRHGVRVESLTREGETYVLTAGNRRFEARQVVVAMASYQVPRVPGFAKDLDPRIVQISSPDYRNPSQLRGGRVLVVGAGNSGSEIALDVARGHRVWMSGRDVGHVPFRISGFWARLFLTRLVLRGIFHRLLTVDTPIGRRVRRGQHGGTPLIRVKPQDLEVAGIARAPRVVGVRGGMPLLEDGTVLEVENVVWCTGFHPGFSWIRLPVLEESGEPRHERGFAEGEPGLSFVGLHFLYAMSSTMIHGVGRDARRVVRAVAERSRAGLSGGRERRPTRRLEASAIGRL
jgi:putative flavoprotein involved in K+ transport